QVLLSSRNLMTAVSAVTKLFISAHICLCSALALSATLTALPRFCASSENFVKSLHWTPFREALVAGEGPGAGEAPGGAGQTPGAGCARAVLSAKAHDKAAQKAVPSHSARVLFMRSLSRPVPIWPATRPLSRLNDFARNPAVLKDLPNSAITRQNAENAMLRDGCDAKAG